jgi:hypothetical protein
MEEFTSVRAAERSMTARSRLMVAVLQVCIVSAAGCWRSAPQPNLCDCETEQSEETVAFDSSDLRSAGDYEEVQEEADAELAFVVEVFIPGWTQAQEHRFLLHRATVDADQKSGHIAGHGWAGCGRSGGCSGHIALSSPVPAAGRAKVHLSMSWSYDTGNNGEFDKDLEFPWLAESKQEFERGIWVRSYFLDMAK